MSETYFLLYFLYRAKRKNPNLWQSRYLLRVISIRYNPLLNRLVAVMVVDCFIGISDSEIQCGLEYDLIDPFEKDVEYTAWDLFPLRSESRGDGVTDT